MAHMHTAFLLFCALCKAAGAASNTFVDAGRVAFDPADNRAWRGTFESKGPIRSYARVHARAIEAGCGLNNDTCTALNSWRQYAFMQQPEQPTEAHGCQDPMADNFGAPGTCKFTCLGNLTSSILTQMQIRLGNDDGQYGGAGTYCFEDDAVALQNATRWNVPDEPKCFDNNTRMAGSLCYSFQRSESTAQSTTTPSTSVFGAMD